MTDPDVQMYNDTLRRTLAEMTVTDEQVEAAAYVAIHNWGSLSDDMRRDYWRPRLRAALAAAQVGAPVEGLLTDAQIEAATESLCKSLDTFVPFDAVRAALAAAHAGMGDVDRYVEGFRAGREAAANEADAHATAYKKAQAEFAYGACVGLSAAIRALRPPAAQAENSK